MAQHVGKPGQNHGAGQARLIPFELKVLF